MHDSVQAFARRVLSRWFVEGANVLSVGSYNVNGSLRAYVESLGCASYLGVDMRPGPEVDVVRDACVPGLCESLGGPFDLVVCTEMLEHAENWRAAVENLKACVRPGGLLLLTTRSRGFALHEYPSDYWRFELGDMRAIFDDHALVALESDPEAPGVFVLASPIANRAAPDLSLVEPHAMRLSVVTWKWGKVFGPEYVNRLRSMLSRHLRVPHDLLCVTDDPGGLDPEVKVVDPRPVLNTLGLWDVEEAMGGSACLRRLVQYDPAVAPLLGRRFLSLDVDLVIVDDVTPLFDRPDPLVLMNWTYTGGTVYGGGIVLSDAGALRGMWDEYRADPAGYGEVSRGSDSVHVARRRTAGQAAAAQLSAEQRRRAANVGYRFIQPGASRPARPFGPPSDQSVLNHYIQTHKVDVGQWTEADGIVRYFCGSRKAYGPPIARPKLGTRIVVFGHDDKDVMETYAHPWVREHWR